MTMVMELQHKFNYFAVVTLIVSMFGILSLRFYIFYMLAVSIGASLLVGLSGTKQSLARNMVVLLLVGFGLIYLGAGSQADVQLATFGNLDAYRSAARHYQNPIAVLRPMWTSRQPAERCRRYRSDLFI